MTAPASALLRECRELLAVMANEYEVGDEASELQHWPASEVERCRKAAELRDRIDAHLAAGSGEGWVSVPVELTEEMKVAGWNALRPHEGDCLLGAAWEAMLKAAPTGEK